VILNAGTRSSGRDSGRGEAVSVETSKPLSQSLRELLMNSKSLREKWAAGKAQPGQLPGTRQSREPVVFDIGAALCGRPAPRAPTQGCSYKGARPATLTRPWVNCQVSRGLASAGNL
jgi:hypothetical protein